MEAKWKKATDYTQECFDKYGLKNLTAVCECRLYAPISGASYDLTILKSDKMYIPAHGTVKMAACKTLKNAKIDALTWFNREMAKSN